jgi:hypothetical protein
MQELHTKFIEILDARIKAAEAESVRWNRDACTLRELKSAYVNVIDDHERYERSKKLESKKPQAESGPTRVPKDESLAVPVSDR